MNEVAAWPVRAETLGMECLAKVRFVLRVTCDVFEFAETMSELTLLAILALTLIFRNMNLHRQSGTFKFKF